MLAPHAVDIAVTISSLIASLCFTFAEPFDYIFLFVKWSCALVSGNSNKSLRPIDWPIDQASEFALAHWHSSNYLISLCFTMFHICRTIRLHFSLRQVKFCIGQRKYKQKFTTQGRKDRPTDRSTKRVNSRSLTKLLFRILQNHTVIKMGKSGNFLLHRFCISWQSSLELKSMNLDTCRYQIHLRKIPNKFLKLWCATLPDF